MSILEFESVLSLSVNNFSQFQHHSNKEYNVICDQRESLLEGGRTSTTYGVVSAAVFSSFIHVLEASGRSDCLSKLEEKRKQNERKYSDAGIIHEQPKRTNFQK